MNPMDELDDLLAHLGVQQESLYEAAEAESPKLREPNSATWCLVMRLCERKARSDQKLERYRERFGEID